MVMPLGFILSSRRNCPLPPRHCLLTFDDGPGDAVTDELLRVLRRFSVKACFCVVGSEVVRRPEQTRAIADDGHLLVNHGFHHRFADLWYRERLELDLSRCDQAVADALGTPSRPLLWFRPPFGVLTPAVREVSKTRRILTITHFAFDTWFNSPTTFKPRKWIVADAKRRNGGIYILHDGLVSSGLSNVVRGYRDRSWIPRVVEEVLTALLAAGFHFPAPSEALA